jgi:hypothetical protein
MSTEAFHSRTGFPVEDLIRQVKNKLGVTRVRVFFDNPNSQAMSRYNGPVLEVHLPTLDTVLRMRPDLTREEAVAKIKSAAIEELCHGVFHQTDHDERVVSCTIENMGQHLTPQEMAYPYIQEKVRKMRGAQTPVKGEPIHP